MSNEKCVKPDKNPQALEYIVIRVLDRLFLITEEPAGVFVTGFWELPETIRKLHRTRFAGTVF